MTQKVTFITNKICPFAHRVWLTLLQKNIQYEQKYVDFGIKQQPWFTQIYHKAFAHDPTSDGKVPILVHGNNVMAQSDLISWYVAQTFSSGTQLIPKDTFQKLKMRRFIQQYIGNVITAFYSTSKMNQKKQQQKKQTLQNVINNLKTIQNNIVGPYILGENITLADILLYPWFARWCVISHYTGIQIPESNIKIKKFIKTMQSRESVAKTQSKVSDQFFIKQYKSYF